MLRLKRKREPYWIDYPFIEGVRIRVEPMTSAMYQAAQGQAGRIMREKSIADGEGGALAILNETSLAEWSGLIARCLAKLAIVGWEGVTEGDGDDPAKLTEEGVDELMDLPRFSQWFQSVYVDPMGETAQEGNASGPARNGTSEAGPNSAEAAGPLDPLVPAEDASRT